MKNTLIVLIVIIVTAIVVAITTLFSLQKAPLPRQSLSNTSEAVLSDEANASFLKETAIILTKNAPFQLIVTSKENGEKYAYFFDGQNWTYGQKDSLIEWFTQKDTDILRQNTTGKVALQNYELSFASTILQNEVALRSDPDFAEFLSAGEAALTINQKSYQSYIVYVRGFGPLDRVSSLPQKFKRFYFWDRLGNFYFIDTNRDTNIDPLTPQYSMGVIKSTDSAVKKTFDVVINSLENNQLQAILSAPIKQSLQFSSLNHSETIDGTGWSILNGSFTTFGSGVIQTNN